MRRQHRSRTTTRFSRTLQISVAFGRILITKPNENRNRFAALPYRTQNDYLKNTVSASHGRDIRRQCIIDRIIIFFRCLALFFFFFFYYTSVYLRKPTYDFESQVSLTDTRPATAMRSCVRASRFAWPRPGDDDFRANATRCGRVHGRAGGVFVGDDVGRRHNVDDGRWRRTVLVTTDRRRVVGARVGRLVDGGRRVTTCYTNRWVFRTITVLMLLFYFLLESRLSILELWHESTLWSTCNTALWLTYVSQIFLRWIIFIIKHWSTLML